MSAVSNSPASSSTSNSYNNIRLDNLENLLNCPVESIPLHEAICLFPCCHKVNQAVAQQLYGIMQGDRCKEQKPCVLCNRKVTAYYPDHHIRGLVQTILGRKGSQEAPLPNFSIKIEEEVKREWDKIPSPGKGAKFVRISGDWEILNSATERVRCIEFESTINDSVLKTLSIIGYRSGDVLIHINFDDKNKAVVKKYFNEQGIIGCDFLTNYFISRTKEITQKLFRVIAKYNEIPEEHFGLIRDLVESGDWRTVTPLKAGETLPSPRSNWVFYRDF